MVLLIAVIAFIFLIPVHGHWINEQFVSDINNNAKHWKASLNHFEEFTEEELRNLANIRGYANMNSVYPTHKYKVCQFPKIPDEFDARFKWSTCQSIGTIRNQEKCGASWAFAAVSVMSDRLCIASDDIVEFTFSPEALISCCELCGDGCYGGYIFTPFEYWKNEGLPSGGDQLSRQGCKPFNATVDRRWTCVKECDAHYDKTWEEDARHGASAYRVYKSEEQIQIEIMNFGPVVASMDIYTDFYVYSQGVYEHVSWELVGRAAVKIIGWGEMNDVPYWLVANSWGTDFGDNGFFKILRGSNHCGIEYEVTAAIPNTDSE